MLLSFMSLALSLPALSIASGNHGGGAMSQGTKSSNSVSSFKKHTSIMTEQQIKSQQRGPVGFPGDPRYAKRSFSITLTDDFKMIFKSPLTEIHSGTVLQFIVKNNGNMPHAFSIKSEDQLIMGVNTFLPLKNIDNNRITIQPGQTGIITWHFVGEDIVFFVCDIPGHSEKGMYQKVALVSDH